MYKTEQAARDVASVLSNRYPGRTVQLYLTPTGSYLHRFETTIQAEMDGCPIRHVACYRNGIDVLAGWVEIEA